jgi:hypothetical protein
MPFDPAVHLGRSSLQMFGRGFTSAKPNALLYGLRIDNAITDCITHRHRNIGTENVCTATLRPPPPPVRGGHSGSTKVDRRMPSGLD